MPDIYLCEIVDASLLQDNIFSITVESQELVKESVAGQFLHIKCGEARILRRPISICRVCDDLINIIFEVKGEGTRWLSERRRGEKLDILGPLGKGYTLPEGKLIIVGGGLGTPPMLFAAESAKSTVTAILGFRGAERVILVDDFNFVCDKVYITTDDGSVGIHGTVTNPLEVLLKTGEYSAVLACGQILMQKAVAEMCKQYNIDCQVSIEERMGCGVGACLVCACETLNEDGTSNMSRACIDGPVFNASTVVWG